jgi:hypothetical protein
LWFQVEESSLMVFFFYPLPTAKEQAGEILIHQHGVERFR